MLTRTAHRTHEHQRRRFSDGAKRQKIGQCEARHSAEVAVAGYLHDRSEIEIERYRGSRRRCLLGDSKECAACVECHALERLPLCRRHYEASPRTEVIQKNVLVLGVIELPDLGESGDGSEAFNSETNKLNVVRCAARNTQHTAHGTSHSRTRAGLLATLNNAPDRLSPGASNSAASDCRSRVAAFLALATSSFGTVSRPACAG